MECTTWNSAGTQSNLPCAKSGEKMTDFEYVNSQSLKNKQKERLNKKQQALEIKKKKKDKKAQEMSEYRSFKDIELMKLLKKASELNPDE